MISGEDFGRDEKSGQVDFGGIEAEIVSWRDRQITVIVPDLPAGSHDVYVIVDERSSNTMLFTISDNTDLISIELPFDGGYWVPTTYDDHGGIGTYNAVDFRYADPQESQVYTWTPTVNEPLVPFQYIRAPHSGLLSAERERFYCGGEEVVQTTVMITDESNEFRTWYAHLETVKPGQWVFIHNTVDDVVNLRSCPDSDDGTCPVISEMHNGELMRVYEGPVLSDDKLYTWWRIWDDADNDNKLDEEEEVGWAVEALASNGRQVLLNSLFRTGDQVTVINGTWNLRTEPCTDDKECRIVKKIYEGMELTIVDGPVRKLDDNWHTWWKVRTTDRPVKEGWMVEAINDVPTVLSSVVSVSAGTVSTPAFAKELETGIYLGNVYNYGCSRSGAHLHFAVSEIGNGFLDLRSEGRVRVDGEVIFAGEELLINDRIAFPALPRE